MNTNTKEKPMTTKTPTKAEAQTLAELEQAEADAMAKVADARAKLTALADAASARKQAAEEAFDRAMLDAWPTERRRLEQEIADARDAFRAAVLADPVWQAYRQHVLAQHRLRTTWLDTSQISSRMGRGEFQMAPPMEETTFTAIARMVALDAEQQGTDEQQARHAAREKAGEA